MISVKKDITSEIIKDLNKAMQKVFQHYKLNNTELSKTAYYDFKDDIFILIANDYFQYVDSGRKVNARRVPIIDIIKWMKKKGITPSFGQTYNSTAYSIVESIYKHGIKAKKFIDPLVAESVDLIALELSDSLSIVIADELAKTLTKTITNK